ncbi:MAG: class I SAM-dependent methyltransferase [Actinomycetota bacterium]|nr:class I SAM-dependent methyltransferase [Actinomycetota bacterium]
MSSPVPSATFQYYGDRYWNSINMVEVELRRRAADQVGQSWGQKLLEWNGRPFQKAIALNCGNGWVERELVRSGVVASAIGLDISEPLLATARESAAAEGLDIEYHCVDTNTASFDFPGVDLVVNFAAMHHVARVDRVMREFCRLLPPDGAFMSWDYIGPHRNQYPEHQWAAIERLNNTLPSGMRKKLAYPHLATMLADDPTEAIHSELIMPTMRRYFHLEHVRYLGGALAYEILCFNDPFFDGNDHSPLVQRILDADAAHMANDPEANTLFAYVLARPDKAALDNTAQLDRWSREEDEREAAAAANGGQYYPSTSVAQRYYPNPGTPPSTFRRIGGKVKRAMRRVGLPV